MRSKKDKLKFLDALSKTSIVSHACNSSGISKATIYRWKKEDKEFEKLFGEAQENGRETINDLAESQVITHIKKGEKWAVELWLVNNHLRYYRPKKPMTPEPPYRGVAQIIYNVFNPKKKEENKPT
jgi:hypothetical protein